MSDHQVYLLNTIIGCREKNNYSVVQNLGANCVTKNFNCTGNCAIPWSEANFNLFMFVLCNSHVRCVFTVIIKWKTLYRKETNN